MRQMTLCFVKKDGKTLMIHKAPKEGAIGVGKYNGLGGKMEEGETPEQAVVREVLEESGFFVKNPTLKGTIFVPADISNNNQDTTVYIFTAQDPEGDLTQGDEGELVWVTDEELVKLPRWASDEIFMPWLEKPETFEATFTYKDGKLVNHQVKFSA